MSPAPALDSLGSGLQGTLRVVLRVGELLLGQAGTEPGLPQSFDLLERSVHRHVLILQISSMHMLDCAT